MIAVVTIEGHKHIYEFYSCIACDDNKVLLRVSHCFWDIVISDIPASVIDFNLSHLTSRGYFDFTQYPCKFLEHSQEETYSYESEDDDFDRERYYQDPLEYER